MFEKSYQKVTNWIEYYRFLLLLLSTLLVLILPALASTGWLSDLFFDGTISFLFIQSMIAAHLRPSRKRIAQVIVFSLIALFWLKPLGIESDYIELVKGFSLLFFFTLVVLSMIRFMIRSQSVDMNVLLASVNIYLLIGIIFAFVAIMIDRVYPGAYGFPDHIGKHTIVPFLYYTFITMTTVGYGDIVPHVPATQTLAYLIAVTGQFYTAIVISFLVGKYLVHSDRKK